MNKEPQQLPDRSLVEAAQNGDLESFGALYRRYHSPMAALAYSVTADRTQAEDVAQEVFAIACGRLRELRQPDKFAAWLAGICRNVARQMLKTRQKTVSEDPPEDCVDDGIEQKDCCDAVRQVVWKLPAAERELIILRYYDGFSQARISEVLGISSLAVNGRLVRAKRRIAKYLERSGLSGDHHETS